jgi:hypothetical protein
MDGGGGQRRFRQRGGAKKKKRKALAASQPGQNEAQGESAVKQHAGGAAYAASASVPDPARHEAPSFQRNEAQWQESQLDTELARYLYQLKDDLARLERESAFNGTWNAPNAADDGKDAFDSDLPPLLLLARNGLVSLHANLHEVAMEPMGSRVLETLIRTVRSDAAVLSTTLSTLLTLGSRRVATLVEHRCGSHVMQSLVTAVAADVTAAGEGHEGMAAMGALCKVLLEWTVSEVRSIMASSCGSHVFRAIVAGLAGIPAEEPKEAKLDDSAGSARIMTYIESGAFDVPQQWLDTVAALAQKILDADSGGELQGMLWAPASSTAFQGLLAATARADRAVAKKLVEAAVNESSFLDVSYDTYGARFMERVVVCLGAAHVMPDLTGHFAEMASDSKANFVLQRVLLGLKGRGAVMSAWDELEASLPKFTGYGSVRDGVVLAMLRAAEVEGDEQARRRAARAIAKSVGAVGNDARHLAGVLITGSLDRWSRWRESVKEWSGRNMGMKSPSPLPEDDTSDVLHFGASPGTSLLGVLMARCLLRFPGGPGQVCRDSMANLQPHEVLALCSQPSGSRLIEQWASFDEEFGNGKVSSNIVSAALDANAIGAASRSPYAAQVLIKSIPKSAVSVRRRAMEALAGRASHLRDHRHGRQVIRKCRVDDFVRRGDDWSTVETARDTRQRMFEDILAPKASDEEAAANDLALAPSEANVKGAKRKHADANAETMSREAKQAARKRRKAEIDGGGLVNVLSAISKAADVDKKKNKRALKV